MVSKLRKFVFVLLCIANILSFFAILLLLTILKEANINIIILIVCLPIYSLLSMIIYRLDKGNE